MTGGDSRLTDAPAPNHPHQGGARMNDPEMLAE